MPQNLQMVDAGDHLMEDVLTLQVGPQGRGRGRPFHSMTEKSIAHCL